MNERWILSTYKPKAIVNFEKQLQSDCEFWSVTHLLNVKNIHQHFGERSLPLEKKIHSHHHMTLNKNHLSTRNMWDFQQLADNEKNSCKI